jgi:predicted double-glycine peptidase
MDQLESSKTSSWRKRKVALVAVIVVPLCGLSVWFFLMHFSAPHLNRLPLTPQSTPYTCGVASLQSVLAYYGEEWREDDLAQELKADPAEGTRYGELVRFARGIGLTAEVRQRMTIEDLTEAVEADHPVIVAIQAWSNKPRSYADDWEDGHYSVVIGIDDEKVYLMDPSTIGNYTFIPIPQFLDRWHDAEIGLDGRMTRLVHLGIIFDKGKKLAYDPDALKPLN